MIDVSTVVTFARGIGTGTDKELDAEEWEAFITDVKLAVSCYCGSIVADGLGYWYSDGGRKTEENYVVIGGQFPARRAAFEESIAALAGNYEQDSIGVLYGVPSFIGPDGSL